MRIPDPSLNRLWIAVLFIAATFFASSPPAKSANPNSLHFRLYSEFENWDRLKKKFSSLTRYPVTVYIAAPQDKIEPKGKVFQELLSLLKEATERKISVFIWPLLSQKDGYWLNQWNAAPFAGYVLRLNEMLKAEGAVFEGVSLDVEMHTDQMRGYGKLLVQLNWKKLIEQFKNSRDSQQFEEALQIIESLCLRIKSDGYKTHVSTLPMILEDFMHHHSEELYLHHLLGFPIPYRSIDDLSVMSYRSMYQLVTGKMNSRMVYEQAALAKQYFGNTASIDIGLIGDMVSPFQLRGFHNPKDLQSDVAAARAAGIHHIGIYSLDGMDQVDEWLDQDFTPKQPAPNVKWNMLKKLMSRLYKTM